MTILMTSENTVEVYNVVPIIRENRAIKFITNISMQEVANVYEKLTYDEKTQRGYKLVTRKTGTTEEKIVNKANIAEMKEKMISGQFFDGGLLAWNVRLNEDGNAYEYDPEENKLTIKCTQISLPDSAQRHQAIYEAVKYGNINADRNFFPLSVSLYSLEDEQSLFAEINGEGQKAHKNRALYLSNSFESTLAKEIIEKSGMSEFVETKFAANKNAKKFLGFSTFYDSLFHKSKGVFKDIKDKNELLELKKWLISFYTELINNRNNFNSIHESIERASVTTYVYASIAKKLYKDKQWKLKLKRLNKEFKYGAFEGDFFRVENPLWLNSVVYINVNGYKILGSTTSKTFAVNETLKFMKLL